MRNKTVYTVISALMLTMLVGCGSSYKQDSFSASSEMYAPEVPMEEAATTYDMEYDNGFAGNTNAAEPAVIPEGRKLITTGSINLETVAYEESLAAISSQVNAMGGYIESMDSYNGSVYSSYRSLRSSSMTARIPEDKLNEFLSTVEGIANVTYKSQSVEDVTLKYVDLQAHVDMLRAEQARLLELMEQAEDIDTLLIIEERLTEVRYQIESYASQLRTYDNKINYSTLYISLEEVEEYQPSVIEKKTAWEEIKDGFMSNLRGVGRFFKELFIGIVSSLPVLVVIAAFAGIIVLIIRKIRRRKKNKKTEETE